MPEYLFYPLLTMTIFPSSLHIVTQRTKFLVNQLFGKLIQINLFQLLDAIKQTRISNAIYDSSLHFLLLLCRKLNYKKKNYLQFEFQFRIKSNHPNWKRFIRFFSSKWHFKHLENLKTK